MAEKPRELPWTEPSWTEVKQGLQNIVDAKVPHGPAMPDAQQPMRELAGEIRIEKAPTFTLLPPSLSGSR